MGVLDITAQLVEQIAHTVEVEVAELWLLVVEQVTVVSVGVVLVYTVQ
jgi:hypothetical protein